MARKSEEIILSEMKARGRLVAAITHGRGEKEARIAYYRLKAQNLEIRARELYIEADRLESLSEEIYEIAKAF